MHQHEAVLIGHNYTSILSIARALGPEGYKVGVIRTGFKKNVSFFERIGRTPEKHSKYISKYYLADASDPDQIIRILLDRFTSNTCKPVIIPVDDVNTETIDRNMNRLRDHFLMPNVGRKQGGIIRLMDKYVQKEQARKAGLPVVEGFPVIIENGSYTIPDGIVYPCFAKAEMPMTARKNYMGRCDSEDELKRLLDKAAAYRDCMMIVERYIDIEKEYCIIGLADGNCVCIPEVTDEIVLGHGAHAGVTCFGSILPPSDEFLPFCNLLKKCICSLDFHGMFTADVLKSKDNGLYFCELNLRIGGSGPAVIGAGVNLPKMFADSLYEEDCGNFDAVCKKLTFASERPLMNDYGMGRISWGQYRRFIRQADYRFMPSRDDKIPFFYYGLFIIRQFIKRLSTKENANSST